MYLGPSGLGIIAQLSNFLAWVNTTINLGTPLGVTTNIADLYKTNSEKTKYRIAQFINYFLGFFFIVSISFVLLNILFSKSISAFIFNENIYQILFVISVLSVPFVVLYSIIEAFLRSFQEIGKLVKISILSNILGVLILIPLIYFFNLTGIGIYLVLFATLPVIIFTIKYRYIFKEYFKIKPEKIRFKDAKGIFKIGFVSLFSSAIHQGVIILLRKIIISNYGLTDNGLYQSVYSLSLNAFSLIYFFLLNYTLPKFSGIKEDTFLVSELNDNLRFVLIILVPVVVLIISFKSIIIPILFSNEFGRASDLLYFQLTGDIFRALAALFGLWLISRVKIKELLIIDFLFNMVLLMTPLILVKYYNFGLKVIPFSYMIAFFVHFIAYFVYTTSSIKFRFSNSSLRGILVSTFLLISVFIISNYYPGYSIYFNIIAIFLWIYIFLNSEEITGIKHFIFEKIKKN